MVKTSIPDAINWLAWVPGTSLSSEGMQGVRAARLITYPWPHLIVDNFLSTSVLARTLAEINPDTHSFEIEYRGTGRIEFSLLKSKTLWKAIYSKRTIRLLSAAFDSLAWKERLGGAVYEYTA
jgi:hypothetical protein